jgi:ribose transport system ATP-binding protein
VLDEVTASMTEAEVKHLGRLLDVVAGQGVAVLWVTHRITEALNLADQVSVLRDGRIAHRGPASTLSVGDLAALLAGEPHAPGPSPRRAPSPRPVRLSQHAPSAGTAGTPPTRPARDRSQPPALRIEGISDAVLRSVTVGVEHREIVGVAGLTGSGRETLLSAAFGHTPRLAGTVRIEGTAVAASRPRDAIRAGAAYLPADRAGAGAMMRLSARENLTIADLRPFWRIPLLRLDIERRIAASWLDRLAVRPSEAVEYRLEALSGGNQQKVLLGRWLRRDPAVLLLDEPTHGVDVAAKAILHDQIRAAAAGGSAVCVSSVDSDELLSVCTRVLVLSGGRLVADLRQAELTRTALAQASLAADRVTDGGTDRVSDE